MSFLDLSESKITITPQFRAFLQSELAQAVSFTALDGEQWNPHKIATAIRNNPDITGAASYDTIVRFLDETAPFNTRSSALQAIAGFLLAFGFVTERDLKFFEHPAYERAAAGLADLYNSSVDIERNRALIGIHRSYRPLARNKLIETVLTLGSPDQGETLSADFRTTVFFVDDPQYAFEESHSYSPFKYDWVRDYIEELEVLAQATAPGIAVCSKRSAFTVIGGDEHAIQGVLHFLEMHWREDCLVGLRSQLSSNFIDFEDGAHAQRDAPMNELELVRGQFSNLFLYPQGIGAHLISEFDGDSAEKLTGGKEGRGLSFQSPASGKMSEQDQYRIEAETMELEIEAALAKCADEKARLGLAIDLLQPDHAVTALNAGADANALHERRRIPMVHAAASLGMRRIISAMLDGEVDLTVRDRFNRLPSACANSCAQDFELRDTLTAAEAKQFEAKGIYRGHGVSPENN